MTDVTPQRFCKNKIDKDGWMQDILLHCIGPQNGETLCPCDLKELAMTDTPERDWAEEIATAIFRVVSDNFAEETPQKITRRIAFDLRKAKATGVLEASRYFSACMKDELPAFKKHMVETFNEMAIKIEKGLA